MSYDCCDGVDGSDSGAADVSSGGVVGTACVSTVGSGSGSASGSSDSTAIERSTSTADSCRLAAAGGALPGRLFFSLGLCTATVTGSSSGMYRIRRQLGQ